jgi:STE24 endopeptidase
MTATRIVAATIAAALAAGAVLLLWQTEVPAGLELEPPAPAELFPAEQLRETARYAGVARGLWLASTLAQLTVLGLLAWRAPRLEAHLRGRRLWRSLALLGLTLVALWLVRLPFGAASHWWRRRHGLSEQGYLHWLVDPWPELLATVIVAALALVVAIALALRLGGRWWLAGGPALAVVGAAVVLAQPLVQSPRLEPLTDRELEREVLELAVRMDVAAVAVEVKDASRRTTRVNAEVIGVGATRRIVLWDTLLDGRLSPAEVRFVVAHELAHVRQAHVRKGMAWFVLLALPLAWVLARATRPRGGLAQPAAVPLAVLVVVALQLALLPFANAVSRRYEAEADWLALRATADPDAARSVFRRFAEENLAQPRPPEWARVVLSTHPPLVERIAMAESFPVSPASRSPAGS